MRFVLLPGNRYDTVGVAPLIQGLSFDALLADKAFDSNWIVEEMNTRGATICISQRPQRKEPLEIDEEMYKWRHLKFRFIVASLYRCRSLRSHAKSDLGCFRLKSKRLTMVQF